MVLENNILKNIIVSGYSGGGGKTHLLKKILQLTETTHQFVVSHTTREPRGKEIEGKDYHFIDERTFRAMKSNGEFLEFSNPREGIFYGTSRSEYRDILNSGKAAAFDIDFYGVKQLLVHPGFREKTCVVAPLPNPLKRYDWMVQRGDMSPKTMSNRVAYSEKKERPFFEDQQNDHLIDWKMKPYDENLPLPDDLLVNIIVNHICGYTKVLEIPKSSMMQ